VSVEKKAGEGERKERTNLVRGDPAPVGAVAVGGMTTGGAMSSQLRQELSAFISQSVLPQTSRVYSRDFLLWKDFVKTETGSDDPFLTGVEDNVSGERQEETSERQERQGGDCIHRCNKVDVCPGDALDRILDIVPYEAGGAKG
jgi:hypothetical protein